MKTIIIWEMCPDRIHRLRNNAELALKNIDLNAHIQINCEEPLISRHGLLGKLPSIQVAGEREVWSCGYGKDISAPEFEELFQVIFGK